MRIIDAILVIFIAFVPFLCQGRDAGILYEVWHSTAAVAMKQVLQKGGTQLTTELVIRSNGKNDLNDVYAKYGLNADIWNVKPQLGFYCLYRKRPNDPSPPIPDCDNINQTAAQHAKWLTQAGFDYISVDITNWPVVNAPTDIAVLRPTEVLFEEWLALRQKGIPTPQIAVWPCSPAGSNTWQWLLDNLYNKPEYQDLIFHLDGKKLVFLPDNPSCYDTGIEQQIRSNGGRNDVTTVKMWAMFGFDAYQRGDWGFFSPCTASANRGAYTTSIVGEGPCEQPASTDAGGAVTEISASGAYMLSQSSLPWANPGHLRGLTLQRLFAKVLTAGAPHLFMSSFNEHIGGRQSPSSGAKIAFNMGLPNDSQRSVVWVDTYASEYSRDIEPSVEGGSRVWEVAASCVSMYKAGQTCTTQPNTLCCTTDDKEVFANVWSLNLPDGSDNLLTTNQDEKNVLKSQGWTENCSPIGGPSVFCVKGDEPDGRSGPFVLYSVQQPNTIPLYRCITSNVKHFISTDVNCEGNKRESLLGYIATQRGGEMLRGLHRCLGKVTGTHTHSLDLLCDAYDTPVLGYVR